MVTSAVLRGDDAAAAAVKEADWRLVPSEADGLAIVIGIDLTVVILSGHGQQQFRSLVLYAFSD